MSESECDDEGYHLLHCPSGGGYFVGHDTTCAEVADLMGGSEGIPGVVVVRGQGRSLAPYDERL